MRNTITLIATSIPLAQGTFRSFFTFAAPPAVLSIRYCISNVPLFMSLRQPKGTSGGLPVDYRHLPQCDLISLFQFAFLIRLQL